MKGIDCVFAVGCGDEKADRPLGNGQSKVYIYRGSLLSSGGTLSYVSAYLIIVGSTVPQLPTCAYRLPFIQLIILALNKWRCLSIWPALSEPTTVDHWASIEGIQAPEA